MKTDREIAKLVADKLVSQFDELVARRPAMNDLIERARKRLEGCCGKGPTKPTGMAPPMPCQECGLVRELVAKLEELEEQHKRDQDWINTAVASCSKKQCSKMHRLLEDAEQRAETAEAELSSLDGPLGLMSVPVRDKSVMDSVRWKQASKIMQERNDWRSKCREADADRDTWEDIATHYDQRVNKVRGFVHLADVTGTSGAAWKALRDIAEVVKAK